MAKIIIVTNTLTRSAILETKNDRCKIVKILIFRSLSREHFQRQFQTFFFFLLWKCKYFYFQKILTFRTKNALFGYFRGRIRKSHCHIWNQRHQICLIARFGAKWKSLNLGPKMPNLSIFDQKCLTWVFLVTILKAVLSYLKSTTLEFI